VKRFEHRPAWSDSHVLSFVTNSSGDYLAVHADLAGITMLIDELEILRAQLKQNDCPHTHLFAREAGGEELTATTVADQQDESRVICHVKIYGWTEEWAVRHGLKPPTA
jgi:hypothetical protein